MGLGDIDEIIMYIYRMHVMIQHPSCVLKAFTPNKTLGRLWGLNQYNQCVGLLPHDSPEETSAAPTGRLTSPATAEPALGSGFPWNSEHRQI